MNKLAQSNIYARLAELRASGDLPSPTGVALALLELTQKENATTAEIARVIQSDPALSGRLLKFANSPRVGFSRPVAAIKDAVVVLGVRVVRQLALGLSVLSNSRSGPCEQFDYLEFWSRSLATALAARSLCAASKSFPPEEAFTCGLLGRVGCLALANLYPASYGELQATASEVESLIALERQNLAIDHIELTAVLLREWGLPNTHIEAVRHHEQTAGVGLSDGSRDRELALLLRLAAWIGRMCIADKETRAALVPRLLGLGKERGHSEDRMEALFNDVVQEWLDWGRILKVPTPDAPSFSDLVERARRSGGNTDKEKRKGLRILVVDDEPFMLDILTLQLKNAGHEVFTASGGNKGLQLALEARPQLIITDWTMPGMDGPAMCQALRKTRYGQLMYIIMLTGLDDEEHLVAAFAAGADDYLVKPFSPQVLAAHIRGGERLIRLREEVDKERAESHRAVVREASLGRIVEESLNEIYIFDSQTLKFVVVNKGARKNLGYSMDELRELTPLDLKLEFSPQSFNEMIGPLRTGKQENIQFETVHRRKDGSLYPAEVHLQLLSYRSSPAFVAIILDTSARLKAVKERTAFEQQLRHTQKMEAIGQLTGGIAHDFNNVLASIMGYAGLALENPAAAGEGKLAEYLTQIYQSGEQARDLITQMLTFCRGGTVESTAMLLPPLVKEAVKMLGSTLPSSIELQTRIDDAIPVVMMDPVQFQQLLMNLCINAKDAMGGSGHIDICLHTVRELEVVCDSCHASMRGDFVELAVSDTGSGIEIEVLARVFDPFFTTKEVGKGSGMGLAMVHGIVHELGGHIRVKTAPGKGSTFRLLFPAASDNAEAVESRREKTILSPVQGSGGHILVVDDEESVAAFLGELFTSRGYQVTVQTDSQAALQSFKENPQDIDLLVTDQTMPKLTGAELVQKMLRLRPDLPAIICTGYSENMNEARAAKLGIQAFLLKPVRPDTLLYTVKELLCNTDSPHFDCP